MSTKENVDANKVLFYHFIVILVQYGYRGSKQAYVYRGYIVEERCSAKIYSSVECTCLGNKQFTDGFNREIHSVLFPVVCSEDAL